MTINLVLFLGLAAFVAFLFAVEAYTAAKGLPTISDRLRTLGRSAPIVVVVTSMLLGILLGHFWAQ